jgi:predicted Zn-dependent protease
VDDGQGRIDPEFAALPSRDLADAALSQARTLGAQHADFRAERIREQSIALSDGNLQGAADADDAGLAVRVVVDGTRGFASAVDLDADSAARAARQAVEVARVGRRDEYRADRAGARAPVSHGCPAALLRGVRVLSTAREGAA